MYSLHSRPWPRVGSATNVYCHHISQLLPGWIEEWNSSDNLFPYRQVCLFLIEFSVYRQWVSANQFRPYLAKEGCSFEEGKRHTIVRLGDKMAALPPQGAASIWEPG